MIYRKQTRVCLKLNSGATNTEYTAASQLISATTISFPLETTGYLYLGYHEPFTTRYFDLGTVASSAATLTLEYYANGTWTAVEDKVDQTAGFTVSGFLSWSNPGTWSRHELAPVSDVELYWLRVSVSTNLTGSPTIQSVLNLFCDAVDLREYYPELVSDTRYLPPSRSNFLEQLNAGKNLVVRKLIQKRAISDESQILDINEVTVAAVHATAHIILDPIANNDEARAQAKQAHDNMIRELDAIALSADLDNSGAIDESEEPEEPMYFNPRA
ncbi:MAG: hypothetical protein E6R04_07955 [Spirochaetes bacterium]|nr:MAG: hypothetical protein E6R04_07955 [Spirochaetota bacterium]